MVFFFIWKNYFETSLLTTMVLSIQLLINKVSKPSVKYWLTFTQISELPTYIKTKKIYIYIYICAFFCHFSCNMKSKKYILKKTRFWNLTSWCSLKLQYITDMTKNIMLKFGFYFLQVSKVYSLIRDILITNIYFPMILNTDIWLKY